MPTLYYDRDDGGTRLPAGIDGDMLGRVSNESIDRFLLLVQSDPVLQRELGITANAGDKPRLSVQRFVELAERHSCRFTVEELRTRPTARSGSLTAEELDHVTGGTGRSADGSWLRIHFPAPGQKGGGYNELVLDDTAGSQE